MILLPLKSDTVLQCLEWIALVVLSLLTRSYPIEPPAQDPDSIGKICFPDVPCAPRANRDWSEAPDEAVLRLANRRRFIPMSPYSGSDSTEGVSEDDSDEPDVLQKVVATDEEPPAKNIWPGAPSAAQILECLPDLNRDSSVAVRASRENVRIGIEKFVDSLSEPRFYPGVGPAQMRKMHYKCTVVYDRVKTCAWPIEFSTAESVTDTVYYGRDRLVPVAPQVPAVE